MDESEFIQHLHSEKLDAQEVRTKYTLQKLSYATVLLGVGALDIDILKIGALGPINLGVLLYLVPWVALAFDLYIMGEDYSVKRFGAFLGANSPHRLEQHWESWVSRNRDPFAPTAMPVLNMLLLLGAAIMIWLGRARIGPFFWVWLTVSALLNWSVFLYYHRLRKHVFKNATSLAAFAPHMPRPIQSLRSVVRRANHVLDLRTYTLIERLFDSCISNPLLLGKLQERAPNYGKREFVLGIDQEGTPVFPVARILTNFAEKVNEHPDLRNWFQESQIDGKPVLLVARWLCHLAGLRHRTVQLFLDHPTAEDYTLIQVRGLHKAEAPGCFDVPCAGHVTGPETIEEALFKELEEELGLSQSDVSVPVSLGSYEYHGDENDPTLYNVEYRAVYRSRLLPGALPKIRFVDGEVAAVALFAVAEVQSTIDAAPDRVASGLTKSWAVYLKH